MSPSRFVFHPHAVQEARAARLWYEQRSPQAAAGFLAELSRSFELIAKYPEAVQQSSLGDRRFVMRTYPFLIAYRVRGTRIEIIAVAHQHRRPGYWKDR
jgi:plasmid stabilization system protein ParE